jgi:aminopeptidase N
MGGAVPLAEAGLHDNVRDPLARGRGTWVLAILARLLGDAFLPALRAFLDRFRDSGATPRDFEAAIAEGTERDLSPFFREWLWMADGSPLLAGEAPASERIEQLAERYP